MRFNFLYEVHKLFQERKPIKRMIGPLVIVFQLKKIMKSSL